MPEHLHSSYNDIHHLVRNASARIATEFQPNLLIAIGGGGYIPARILRTFLKDEAKKNLQMHAIGLSLYEVLPGTTAEQVGNEVIRTQWLGPGSGKLLLGKRVLIVDEVDDTRKTLHYAISELQKDVDEELSRLPEGDHELLRSQTKFGIFVVHNKNKEKMATLPSGTPYFAGAEVPDVWLDYPWEAVNIEEHDVLAQKDKANLTSQ